MTESHLFRGTAKKTLQARILPPITNFPLKTYFCLFNDSLCFYILSYAILSTVTIWIPDKSGIQMVDLCLVAKWSGIPMVVWKPDWKKPVYGPKCLVFDWSAKSRYFTIWILDTHTVRYSDVWYSDFRHKEYTTGLLWLDRYKPFFYLGVPDWATKNSFVNTELLYKLHFPQ